MGKVQQIVVCGQSIFILAIEAGLVALPEVNVVRFNSHLPAVADRIAALEPDAVITDVDEGNRDLALALLERGLPLIEVDETQGVLSVLKRHRLPVQSVEGLAQAIEQIATIEQSAATEQTSAGT